MLLNDCWHHVRSFLEQTQLVFSTRQNEGLHDNNSWGDEVLKLLDTTGSNFDSKLRKRRGINDKIWLNKNILQEGRVAIMAENMLNNWQHYPTFHLLTIVNHHELAALAETLNSLQQQLYSAFGFPS